ncbi:flavin monoamine oxidase family protein [Janthinobacterium sp. LB2P10]|uniref:flavin monoamine oxidase family protein n=1 Tax=Janthinobacterium sp. LB2P10 TaxID=3424194 RepID=UPI003F242D2F
MMDTSFRAPPDAVIVIGAGLAGLLSAYLLEQQGQSVLLIESRERIGGRVLSDAAHTGAPFVDLGPSWVWPEINERLSHWSATLGLKLFAQHQHGAAVMEMQNHAVLRQETTYVQVPSSQRWEGGAAALLNALSARLERTQMLFNAQVTLIRHAPDNAVSVVVDGPQGQQQWRGSAAIITLPPRLLAERIRWEPELPASLTAQWQRSPTWMAGQAKLVASYKTPFWREAGLSGDAASKAGPLVEIHDASDASGLSAALFGFVGVSASWRAKMGEAELVQRSLQQLGRLFGPEATAPEWVHLKDWAQDPHTATPADALPVNSHPTQPPRKLPAPWDALVYLGGSEFADDFNGYLEGAARSAEMVVQEWRGQALC